MMKYKGYIGRLEYDDEAGLFHGEVINARIAIIRAAMREHKNLDVWIKDSLAAVAGTLASWHKVKP